MLDLSNVKNITLNGTEVTQIEDSLGTVLWTSVQPDYFYVEDRSGSSNTLTVMKGGSGAPTLTVYTSTDLNTWRSNGTTSTSPYVTFTIPANSKLYVKCTADTWASSVSAYNKMYASGNFAVGGNIMSLLYGDNFVNQTTLEYDYSFNDLFYKASKLVDASDLELPATTLSTMCYRQMFYECSSLITAPAALPATTLAESCYNQMFYGCQNLTTAPATLPATTLTNFCYTSMFSHCYFITTAPTLPATTLANCCYYHMFEYCYRITTAPDLPATTLSSECYSNMFYGCRALTTAPALPATTLTNYCYYYMFNGCTNLNSVTTYATDISANNCLDNWLSNVASTGDFYNLGGASYTSGASGIPTGWTEHTTPTTSSYFYIEDRSGSANTLSIIKYNASAPTLTVYSSTDGTNWTSMGSTDTTAITATIPANSKLYVKCTANQWASSSSAYNKMYASGNFAIGGNIMSLLYGDNYEGQTTLEYNFSFVSLFTDATTLVDVSDLELPATTLTENCYRSMFNGCMALTQAPALPATTLVKSCYSFMFSTCKSLTAAPNLPATILTESCYYGMFFGCSNLNSVTIYATDISATNCLNYWLNSVASTGDFYNLGGATYTADSTSGIPTGWTEHTSI